MKIVYLSFDEQLYETLEIMRRERIRIERPSKNSKKLKHHS
jgi:hypothetical protein